MIFVTGANGFLGRHVVEHLLARFFAATSIHLGAKTSCSSAVMRATSASTSPTMKSTQL